MASLAARPLVLVIGSNYLEVRVREELDIVEEVLDGEVVQPVGHFRWEYKIHPEDHYGEPMPYRILTVRVYDAWFVEASRPELDRFWEWIREMKKFS
jgi:hypothetical protein